MQLCAYMRRNSFEYMKDLVLAAVRLGSRRGVFCCRARLHAALFVLS